MIFKNTTCRQCPVDSCRADKRRVPFLASFDGASADSDANKMLKMSGLAVSMRSHFVPHEKPYFH
jgi:hypothetical protein